MSSVFTLLAPLVPLLAWLTVARAEDPGRELELIESTERNEDPLGIDRTTGKELEQAAAKLKPRVEKQVLPTPERGETLSAIGGIREASHNVTIELKQGLAFVTVRMAFQSRARHAAEVAYRLPLPQSSAPFALNVCVRERCTAASPGASEDYARALTREGATTPVLSAEPIRDRSGRALALRAAPLLPSSEMTIEITYVASAPLRGGRVRFELPAHGYDPRLAPSAVEVRARELAELTPSDRLEADPWQPIEIAAVFDGRAIRTVEERAPCGLKPCVRRYEAAPSGPLSSRPVHLLIDASPSLEGPARSRAGVAIAALLSAIPEQTRVRTFAFAARAIDLGAFEAGSAPLATLSDAPMMDLDAATYPSTALALASDLARVKPLVVVVSDGLFDGSSREREALAAARRAGAELILLSVGERAPRLADQFQRVLELRALADRALRKGELEPLIEALRSVEAPRARGELVAGEERALESSPKHPWTPAPKAPWLSFWLARDRPLAFHAIATGASARAIAASPYTAEELAPARPDTGMPAETVLSLLRDQLVPQARGCLRSDRKGRGDYAVGLTFHVSFADREAYDTRVEGPIPEPLRRCLEALVPKLRVPAFSGRIRVRYPIHTEREAPPPVIELEPEVSRTLERAFGAPTALP